MLSGLFEEKVSRRNVSLDFEIALRRPSFLYRALTPTSALSCAAASCVLWGDFVISAFSHKRLECLKENLTPTGKMKQKGKREDLLVGTSVLPDELGSKQIKLLYLRVRNTIPHKAEPQ